MTTTTRKVTAGAATALALGSVLGGFFPASHAFAQDPGLRGYDTVGTNLGTIRPAGYNRQVICIDAGAATPTMRTQPTTRTNAQVGYLLSKYSQTTDKNMAAAVTYVVKTMIDSDQADVAKAYNSMPGYGSAAYSAFSKDVAQLRSEITKYAGSYTASAVLKQNGGNDGTATIGVKSSTGAYVPGITMTATLTGGATWQATGTATRTFTTGTSPTVIGWFGKTGSIVHVNVTATNVPAVTYLEHPKQATGHWQRVVEEASPTTLQAQDPTDIHLTGISSQSGASYLNPGGSAADKIFVKGAQPNTTITVRANLYGPYDSAPTASTSISGKLVAYKDTQVKTDGSGNATVTSAAFTVSKAGYYQFREQTMGSGGLIGAMGETSEQFQVIQPWMTTSTSDAEVQLGEPLTDTVRVYRVVEQGFQATAKATLYGPMAVNDHGTCSGVNWSNAPVAGTAVIAKNQTTGAVTSIVRASGTYITGAVTPKEYGCYTWAESLMRNGVEIAHTTPGVATETTLVTSTTVSTHTSREVASDGATLTDKIDIKGAADGNIIHPALYGPVAVPTSGDCGDVTDADWAKAAQQEAPVLTAGTDFTLANGVGTITSAALPVHGGGCYSWAEGMQTAAGQPTVAATQPGAANEMTLVTSGKAVTQTSDQVVKAGAQITDTITVSGIYNEDATGTATLYGYLPASSVESCNAITPAQWADAIKSGKATALSTQNLTLSGDGNVTTKPVTVTKSGCVSWAEDFTVPSSGDHFGSGAGSTHESTLVITPSGHTQTSAPVVSTGSQITDTIVTSGWAGQPGTAKASLYGYIDPGLSATSCSAITPAQWQQAISSGKARQIGDLQTIAISGDGTYTTKPVTVTNSGCVTWMEQFSVPSTGSAWTTPPGDTHESTLVVGTPSVSTIAGSTSTTVGAVLTDQVKVSGLHGQSAKIGGKLLGPIAPNASGSCKGLNWTGAPTAMTIAPVVVKGDGTYTVGKYTVGKAGCYTYVETVTPSLHGGKVVNTHPGESTETKLVKPKGGGHKVVIQTGVPGGNSNNDGLIGGAAGLGAAALAAAGVKMARRNKVTE